MVCKSCGGKLKIEESVGDDENVYRRRKCRKCGCFMWTIEVEDESDVTEKEIRRLRNIQSKESQALREKNDETDRAKLL